MAGGLQQQLDEVGGFLPCLFAALAEAEDFLELIDQQKQVGTFLDVGLPVGLDESEAAAAERGPGLQDVLLVDVSEQVGLDQGLGELGQRIAAGPHDGQLPGDGGAGHGAAVQFRQQAGPDEGGFAAAGGTDDG